MKTDIWKNEWVKKHPILIDIRDCGEGDLIHFTTDSGNRYEGIILNIEAVGKVNRDWARYESKQDYYVEVERLRGMGNLKILYSLMRIEHRESGTTSKATNSNKFYYLLCK